MRPAFFIMILFLLVIPCSAQVTATDSIPAPDQYAGRWILINPGSDGSNVPMWNFHGNLTGREIYNTGRSLGLYMKEDELPVIDDVAVFFSFPESRIEISGLKPGLDLLLYVDFVRYSGKNAAAPVRLDILVAHGSSSETVASLVSTDLPDRGMYRISLPPNITFTGSFSLIFREYSREKGTWGFWDCIIADRKIDPSMLPLNRPSVPGPMPGNAMKLIE